jgi:glutathione S-transferase
MDILFGVPVSPYVRKAMLAHAYKGISYELKLTLPKSKDPQFRLTSPLGKVPSYQTHNGSGFADSSVIVAYLEKTSDQNKLYPDNHSDFAKALWFEEYADTQLTDVAGGLFYHLMIGPKFYLHEMDLDRVEQLKQNLIPKALTLLENLLGSNKYFVGNKFSIADLAVGGCLMNLYHVDFYVDKDIWPSLANFYQDFMARDIVQHQLKQEQRILA